MKNRFYFTPEKNSDFTRLFSFGSERIHRVSKPLRSFRLSSGINRIRSKASDVAGRPAPYEWDSSAKEDFKFPAISCNTWGERADVIQTLLRGWGAPQRPGWLQRQRISRKRLQTGFNVRWDHRFSQDNRRHSRLANPETGKSSGQLSKQTHKL